MAAQLAAIEHERRDRLRKSKGTGSDERIGRVETGHIAAADISMEDIVFEGSAAAAAAAGDDDDVVADDDALEEDLAEQGVIIEPSAMQGHTATAAAWASPNKRDLEGNIILDDVLL
eukprot:jgi/Hompol1/2475/HPOL_000094-RA